VTVIAATNRPDMIDEALLRPGRIERHIYVPPPDAEGRKKIFEVYLREAGALLASDVSIDTLVTETDGFVGADIEALVREAKLVAMREFLVAMAGRSEQEMADAVVNVLVTKKHFEDAQEKVNASLDQDALESSERQAWEMLYNQEQRTILENALAAIKMAELKKSKDKNVLNLRAEVYKRKKDFNEIKKLTYKLEEAPEHGVLPKHAV
jgi:transitional endoplasmic reticulum ATPase